MPTRLLITGGTGTLGSHLVRLAEKSNGWDEVHSTYCKSNPNYHKVHWHYTDARNMIRPILEKIQPTHIIHTLAMTSPDMCESRKLDAWQINVEVTKEISAYTEARQSRLIFTSTDLVFDGTRGYYNENDAPNPINFYADTKCEAENEIQERLPLGSFVLARIGLLYGFNLNQRRVFFDDLVDAIQKQERLELFQDQFRSFLYVGNAAECLLEMATNDFKGILHVGGPERTSRFEFAQRVSHYLKKPDKNLIPTSMLSALLKARRPPDASLNISLAKEKLKTHIVSIEEGLKLIFS